jgi:hypothetical protein
MSDHRSGIASADHDGSVRAVRTALAALALLGGCAVLDDEDGCFRAVARDVVWSDAATDRMIFTARGASCAEADIEVKITDPRGAVLLRQRAIGYLMGEFGDNAPSPAPVIEASEIDRFLDSLASSAAATRSTRDLPEWPAGADAPLRPPEPHHYDPLVPRDQYEAWRVRNLNLLCIDTGPEAATCFIYDHDTRTAVALASYGI